MITVARCLLSGLSGLISNLQSSVSCLVIGSVIKVTNRYDKCHFLLFEFGLILTLKVEIIYKGIIEITKMVWFKTHNDETINFHYLDQLFSNFFNPYSKIRL